MKRPSMAQRDKADKAFDKRMGVKQGSAKDKAIDRAVGVSKYEYGGKGGGGKRKK